LRHTPRATSGWFVYGLLSIRAAAPLAHLQAAARVAGPDGVVNPMPRSSRSVGDGAARRRSPVVGVRPHRIASTPEVRRHRIDRPCPEPGDHQPAEHVGGVRLRMARWAERHQALELEVRTPMGAIMPAFCARQRRSRRPGRLSDRSAGAGADSSGLLAGNRSCGTRATGHRRNRTHYRHSATA